MPEPRHELGQGCPSCDAKRHAREIAALRAKLEAVEREAYIPETARIAFAALRAELAASKSNERAWFRQVERMRDEIKRQDEWNSMMDERQ